MAPVQVPLVDVIDVCKKPGPGGACLSDPVGGKIPGPDDGDVCCVGSCTELEIGKIIDEKACEECELAVRFWVSVAAMLRCRPAFVSLHSCSRMFRHLSACGRAPSCRSVSYHCE